MEHFLQINHRLCLYLYIPEFQVADIVEDYNILEEARRVASQIVSDPNWRENADWQVLGAHLRSQGEFD